MANPLFAAMNGQTAGAPGGMTDMISRFNQFRQAFSGDPRQAVQQLLNSGRMTQAQYNQLARQATELRNILGSMR